MTNKAMTHPVQVYSKLPDPDSCYTFDNGLDLFGEEDKEFDKIRGRYGETYYGFRLILYRHKKFGPIMAKLWLEYSWDHEATCGSLVRFLAKMSSCNISAAVLAEARDVHIDSHIVDWRSTGSGSPQVTYAFEAIGQWGMRNSLVSVCRRFQTTYTKMETLYGRVLSR